MCQIPAAPPLNNSGIRDDLQPVRRRGISAACGKLQYHSPPRFHRQDLRDHYTWESEPMSFHHPPVTHRHLGHNRVTADHAATQYGNTIYPEQRKPGGATSRSKPYPIRRGDTGYRAPSPVWFQTAGRPRPGAHRARSGRILRPPGTIHFHATPHVALDPRRAAARDAAHLRETRKKPLLLRQAASGPPPEARDVLAPRRDARRPH